MKTRFMLSLAVFAVFTARVQAVDFRNSKAASEFSFTGAPSAADWRYLQHAQEWELRELWASHQQQNKALKDWSWQWRVGWVKVCARTKTQFCGEILREGMNDKAMVVRAEAAASLGEKFAGTADKSIMDQLARAFQEKNNARNGKPLLVLYRILYALNQIGGVQSDSVATNLALSYPQTSRYWDILSHHRI